MAQRLIAAGSTTLGTVTTGDDIYVLGGSAAMVTAMDQSALASILSVDIGNEFNGSFGTSTAPFKAELTGTFWYNAGGGNAYWVSESAGADPDESAKLIIPRTASGHMHFDGGTITSAEVSAGQFTIATGAIVTNLYCSAGVVRFYDSASTDPTIIQNSGILYLDRGCTTLTHFGNGQTWIQGVNANAITTCNVYSSGCHIVESGTITTLNCWGGIPSVAKLQRPLTISNTNINMSLAGAESFLQNPLLTHSSTTKYMGR